MLTKPFEALQLGDHTTTRARTITETDIVLFASLSGDWYPLHTDSDYAAHSIFGQRVAHGLLILAITSGLLIMEPRLVVAFYGMDRVRFTGPTFIGDTIHVETEVVVREDRAERGGLVTFQIETKKSTGETVLVALLKILVAKADPTSS